MAARSKSIYQRRASGAKSKFFSTTDFGGGGDDFEEWKRARQLLKPLDQVPLSDLELKEELACVLTCTNPRQAKGLVEFNYAQGCFLAQPPPGNTVVLFQQRGTAIHKESDEALQQMAELGDVEFEEEPEPVIPEKVEGIESVANDEMEGEDEEGEDEGENQPGEDAADDVPPAGGPKKKITNQFNFCERAALTYNNPSRSQETQTVPPPEEDFSEMVLQWTIFDAYADDYAMQQREKEKEKKVVLPAKRTTHKKTHKSDAHEDYEHRLLVAWKTLERMVNLNTYEDIAKDYRYFEDPADEYIKEEGTCLPLWKFTYEKTRKSMVTDVMWNPLYYDLFVVSFGTFDLSIPCPGAVCLFTLKNPSYPEHICVTESGAMCVDVHPKYPSMVVAGLQDGTVYVYNVTISNEPQYKSNAVTNKHNGMVWQVKWAENLQDGEMNFFSASADGKINNWILMLNELSLITIITLYLDKDLVAGPESTFIKLKASASCLIFHPTDPLVFLVGTKEGKIYKCSTLYSSSYLFTYHAHSMPIYRLDYNFYNSSIFASCSADWRVKIWEDDRPEPLYVFDLGTPIGCVKWAPYSSTVFGAVSQADGKVYVFDLNVNKYKAICKQNVVSKKKNRLTRLCFNTKLPILLVGDEKGCVHTLKLSPNLRIPCKAPKKQQHLDQFTLQCMKLDKLLALVREPPVLTPPEDVEVIIED